MGEHRRDRVAHLLHHELARLLLREAADPRLAGVTITAVQLTADLKIARVYYRTLSAEPPPDVARALRRATPFLRGQLGRTLGMRSTPELRFAFDTLPDTARRVDALLHEAQGTPVGTPGGGGPDAAAGPGGGAAPAPGSGAAPPPPRHDDGGEDRG